MIYPLAGVALLSVAWGANLATVDSRMLFVPSFSLDSADGQCCGIWSRSQLEEMDAAFVAAVEAAFANGSESLRAASTTIRVGVARHGSGAAIERAFGELPPKLRAAATLALIEQEPYDEIARGLGISVNGVKSRVFRAVRILREKLQWIRID